MIRSIFLSSSFMVVALAGCGGVGVDTVPVGGVVMLDGSPVEGASVTFLSDETSGTRVATGKTDASGKFTLKTIVGEQSADGAVQGTHKIMVAKTQSDGDEGVRQAGETDQEMVARMAGVAVNTSEVKQTYIIAKKYSMPENSGLTATIGPSGDTNITLEVTSK
jgi:hypothetical protein